MYDKIEELESQCIDAKVKKETIEAKKLTGDNIYKVLIYFDKLYKVASRNNSRNIKKTLVIFTKLTLKTKVLCFDVDIV